MQNPSSQQNLDYEAIRITLYRFAEALDNRDWALMRSLCHDEIDADFTAWGLSRQQMSADVFVNSYKQSFWRPEMHTQHLYTNFRIDIEGDQAEVVFNFLGQHYTPQFRYGEEFTLRGEYTDTLRRNGNIWLITGAKLRLFYATGASQMLAPDA